MIVVYVLLKSYTTMYVRDLNLTNIMNMVHDLIDLVLQNPHKNAIGGEILQVG